MFTSHRLDSVSLKARVGKSVVANTQEIEKRRKERRKTEGFLRMVDREWEGLCKERILIIWLKRGEWDEEGMMVLWK